MGKFEMKMEKNGTEIKATVIGTIDEDVDFTPHTLAGATSVDLYLGALKSINSCGIRDWIKWMSTAGSAKIRFFECPKIIVDQINMVQGFLPAQGSVVSFFVPFYSDEAGTEKNVLFTHGAEFNDQGIAKIPEVKDESGNVMEMDVVEAKYFKFLKK